MPIVAIIVMGLVSGYISIWTAVKFNDTLDKRINIILLSVVVDVIMITLFTLIVSGSIFTIFLIAKYVFLSIINFDRTLRQ